MGFVVDAGVVTLGKVCIELVGHESGRGFLGWCLGGVDEDVDGITSLPTETAPTRSAWVGHSNGVFAMDHVVVTSDDVDRTESALGQVGVECRRAETYQHNGKAHARRFFWLGRTILELIGPDSADPDGIGVATVFGLAVATEDLDVTLDFLGESISEPRDAVQEGRKIATVDTAALDVSVPVVVLSPHPSSGIGSMRSSTEER